MLIAGDREAADGTVAVRRRDTREQEVMPFAQFEAMIRGGELRDLNRRYRQYRLTRNAAGNGAVSSPRWLENYKAESIRKMASALSPGDRERLAG